MKSSYIGSVASVLFIVVLATASAQDAAKSTDDKAGAAKASDEVIAAMAQFKPVAQSTLDLVNKGDMAAAKTEITKLESAWDAKEETLRPKYPAEWKIIDVAIDKALSTVRKPATPDAEKSKAALQYVIAKIENPVATPKNADKPAK